MPESDSSESGSSPESSSSSRGESPNHNGPSHDRQADIRKVAKILRDGNYSYDQSAHLIKKARRKVGLSPPDRSGSGSPERLSSEEQEAFLSAAYDRNGRTGLQMRVLLETGARVSAFVQVRVEDISFRDLEIRLRHTKGEKPRDVPILSSLANELKLHVGERETGWLFRSRQGGHYSKRRIQQIVKSVAEDAGIQKRVYPHLLRHTVAQRLADEGMREELLQQFLGHEAPETTQRYYEPKRTRVKEAFEEAMSR
ncbi:tyrosine-type recombinase/integrase [Salinibacter ruber]|uniref:tyrosine-type recombinase/integrase n=1 Tax=Salinibacter ruber TaxID=146919 RepID=UPI00216A53ED|nr:site-specific integrase [Salinibacter ruber]MCS4034457.1 integrase/recombinase XerD [Salinibacter ruber]MCS4050703.1 integrase/recombinase XerD [Salinibacter ruber]